MAVLRRYGVEAPFLVSFFRFLVRRSSSSSILSAASNSTPRTQQLVDYFVESLGFSSKEAISLASRAYRLRSPERADSVVDIFRRYGIDLSRIRRMVSSAPGLLSYRAETLDCKIDAIQGLGFSGSDSINLIKNSPQLLLRRVDTHIKPVVDCMRLVLGSNGDVVKAINRSQVFVSTNGLKRIQNSITLLRSRGVSEKTIRKLVLYNTRSLLREIDSQQDVVRRVIEEFGIPGGSPTFFHGFHVISGLRKSTLEKKFGVYRSFGWSDSDIYALARSQPVCLGISVSKLCNGLNFFMKELGYTTAYIASRGTLLLYSLEKRVKPRNEVLKALKESKATVDRISCLYTVLLKSDSKFLEKFVIPYKDEIPFLLDSYLNNSKRQ